MRGTFAAHAPACVAQVGALAARVAVHVCAIVVQVAARVVEVRDTSAGRDTPEGRVWIAAAQGKHRRKRRKKRVRRANRVLRRLPCIRNVLETREVRAFLQIKSETHHFH